MISDILEGNRRFVETEFNTHSEFYKELSVQQRPQVLWIGCSDSRVSEDVITGSKPGTMFVHRNIANLVSFSDVNLAAILEYALVHLKIPDVVVCGHTNCGGVRAIEDGVDESYIADWLLIASGAKKQADKIAAEGNISRAEKLDLLAKLNVELQVAHLQSISLIRRMRARGEGPRLHGWLYSVETGKISVVRDGDQE